MQNINKQLPVKIREMTEDAAEELRDFGFIVERIVLDLHLVTFKKVTNERQS